MTYFYDTYKKGERQHWGILQIKKKGLRDTGATLAPSAANQIALGSETLALRLPRACSNAMALAKVFQSHPAVKRVYYPGLETHPEHLRAKQLFADFGTLLSIDLVDEKGGFSFLNRLQCPVLSSHLGDNRTLVIPVAHTIFHEMGAERRATMGISDGTIRISVGIEDRSDLLEDFSQALEKSGTNHSLIKQR